MYIWTTNIVFGANFQYFLISSLFYFLIGSFWWNRFKQMQYLPELTLFNLFPKLKINPKSKIGGH